MIKAEFEQQIGCKISDAEFDTAQLCYNYLPYSEEIFITEWKKNSQSFILETIAALESTLSKCQIKLDHSIECDKRHSIELSLARDQIKLLNDKLSCIYDSIYGMDYNSCKELQIVVSKFFDNNKIIVWKLKNNIQLSEKEIAIVDNNINKL